MSFQLAQGVRTASWVGAWILLTHHCSAHVGLLSPNGGESLSSGSQFTIQWQVEIQHSTQNWDLWYATESEAGPWQSIATDLTAGDISDGALHSFEWTLPSIVDSSAWVRVRQDNAGTDYFDVSDASFSIASLPGGGDFNGDGSVDAVDLSAWRRAYRTVSGATPTDGDANLDGDVDGADFLVWQSDFGRSPPAVVARPVPEPAATVLLVLGMILMLWQRR